MFTRKDLAPICRAIADLYVPNSTAQSSEQLPGSYALNESRKDEWMALVRRMVHARLVSRRHLAVLEAVLRSWDGQPAVVRVMTLGLADLLRMIERERQEDTPAPGNRRPSRRRQTHA